MSFLDIPKIAASRHVDQDGDNGRWFPLRGHHVKTKAGAVITESTALKLSAYWCGVRIITEAMASIVIEVKKVSRNSEGHRVSFDQYDHPVARIFNSNPNSQQDAFTFRDFMQLMLLNWGTCYAEKQYDHKGNLVNLWPIHSSRIKEIVRVTNPSDGFELGDLVFMVRNDASEPATPIHESDMLWISGPLSEDGITGKSTVRWQAETLGLAASQDEHVGGFFKNGASPDIAVTIPGDPDREKRSELRESWKKIHAGSHNSHELMLLWGGMEAKTIGINPDDAQLLESRQFTVVEIARALKLQPHLLGSLENHKRNTLEEQSRDFLQHTIQPWAKRWCQSISLRCLSDKERRDGLEVRANMRSLQALDLKTHTEHLKDMSGIGAYSINDVLEELGRNPIPNGDVRLVNGNNLVPLDQAAKGMHKAAGGQGGE